MVNHKEKSEPWYLVDHVVCALRMSQKLSNVIQMKKKSLCLMQEISKKVKHCKWQLSYLSYLTIVSDSLNISQHLKKWVDTLTQNCYYFSESMDCV